MINVKDQVYAALQPITTNVSDGYPKSWAVLPAIKYIEEANSVAEWTDGRESKSQLRYRIDVWDNVSTSATALAVDAAMSRLGLIRTTCNDVDDPSGLKHKVMIYSGIIDVDTEQMYDTISYM